LFGNPSAAKKETTSPDNYLVEKKQFVLAYNESKGISNWVSWHLEQSWVGNTKRQDDFRPDADLPNTYYKVSDGSYSGSGFDRGHLCPSGDRTSDVATNSATFVMSNMFPQAPDVNQMNWAKLEDYCRDLMFAGNELYIIAGGYGQGGTGNNGSVTKTIDNGKVWVPSNCWKVVVIMPKGDDDFNRFTASNRVIAIDIPNKNSFGTKSWGDYRVSINDIEAKTKFDILSNLPQALQDQIEGGVDNGPTTK
jgi:endonuclease G